MVDVPADPDKITIRFPCIRATQPIGDLYIGSVGHRDLIKFTYFDVRRVVSHEREIETYLGVQRPIHRARLTDLEQYVNFVDATFPTSVIIAINDADYASYDSRSREMVLRNFRVDEDKPSIAIRQLGRVIDGQHRIAGLEAFTGNQFDVSVTLFVEADIADQAHIFSTVNLEQTKVNKSLVYDLYELAQTRSPQKTCHLVAVALDRDPASPLAKRIKRLGFATQGRSFEPVTQATFVEGLLVLITKDAKADRDTLLRKARLEKAGGDELFRTPFRNLFVDGKDLDIIQIVFNYFEAVKRKWPDAWDERGAGRILNRTNGVKALLRFLRNAYLQVAAPGDVPRTEKFYDRVFQQIPLVDDDFTIENFPPGTSGEAKLYSALKGKVEI